MKKRTTKLVLGLMGIGVLAVTGAIVGVIPYAMNNNNDNLNNNSKEQNTKIANEIAGYINNPIQIHSDLTANEALLANNQSKVKSLILQTIKNDLDNKKITIGENIYSGIEIFKYISVQLPNNITYTQYLNGEIPGVILNYGTGNNEVEIKPNNSNFYTVTGFLKPNPNLSNTQTNQNIANELNSLLNQIIKITGFENITPSPNLLVSTNQQTLKEAIKTGILNQINASNKSFIFNNIVYSAQDIVNGISVTLPQNVTMLDEENGTMHDVTLQYNGIDLSNTANSKDFIVEPFKETSSQNIINNNSTGIISQLELLINDPIVLNNYHLTVEQSLMPENHQTLLNAINEVIEDEIGKGILVNNIVFTTSEIMQNLTITIPKTDSYDNYMAGELTGVTISYNNTPLKNKIGSVDYTVTGFLKPNPNLSNTQTNQNIANELNSLLNQIIKITGFENTTPSGNLSNSSAQDNLKLGIKNGILNQIDASNKTFIFNNIVYSAQDIVNGISVTLPQNVTMSDEENGTMHDVTLQYNGIDLSNTANSKDFIVEPFKETSSQNIINNNSSGIVSKLELLINDPIVLNNYHLTVEQSLMSQNHQILLSAIEQIIENDLGSVIECNNVVFTTSEIMQNLNINIPTTDSYDNYAAGKLTDVTISYNNTSLKNKTGSVDYTVTGFEKPNPNLSNTQTNQSIANELNSLLNQIIKITGFENSTPSSNLSNSPAQENLKLGIKNGILNQINASNKSFIFNNIVYSAQDIVNGISVTLPQNVTMSDEENGTMHNVTLQYNGIDLSNTANSKNFIVEPFEETSSQNIINNTEGGIITKLSWSIKDPITLNDYDLTVEQSLMSQNHQTLLSAIEQVIEGEIGKEIIVENIILTTSEIMQNLTITIPKTDSYDNYVAGKLTDVAISYNNIPLQNPTGTNDYTVTGFAIPSHDEINTLDKIVCKKLSDIITNPVTIYNGAANYTADQFVQPSIFKEVVNGLFSSPQDCSLGAQTDNNMTPINANNILYYGYDLDFGEGLNKSSALECENQTGTISDCFWLVFPHLSSNYIYTKQGSQYWDIAGLKKGSEVTTDTNKNTSSSSKKTTDIVDLLSIYIKNNIDKYFKDHIVHLNK